MKKENFAQTKATPSQKSIEQAVAKVWAELLGLNAVGSEDNFLLLGGESLLATQAMARLRDLYGMDVSLRSILIGTVADVAKEISSGLTTLNK